MKTGDSEAGYVKLSSMSEHHCPYCGTKSMYRVFSGGKEWYCPGCEADGSYEEGEAPRRAQLLQSEDGRTALRAGSGDRPAGRCRGSTGPPELREVDQRMSDVKRYRKKPVAVRAIQWTGTNLPQVAAFLGEDYTGARGEILLIRTLENPDSPFQARPGWWIIEGVRGEHYACEPGIFAETYEEA